MLMMRSKTQVLSVPKMCYCHWLLRPHCYPILIAVTAAVPSILNESAGGLTLLDGDLSTIQCQSTPTRPAATISWKIGSSVLSDTDTREVTEAGGLVSTISTVSLVAQQVFNDANIICQSKINGQTGTPETRKLLKVWCKYIHSCFSSPESKVHCEVTVYQSSFGVR